MAKIYSFLDRDGKLWTSCAECKRGWNYDASCSCGTKKKSPRLFGCFCGETIPEVLEKLQKKNSTK